VQRSRLCRDLLLFSVHCFSEACAGTNLPNCEPRYQLKITQ
jgi:hypothetical protein